MVTVGLVAGCGSKSNSCVPGQSTACVCGDGSGGAQVCQHDGTFGACMCRVVGGGTGGNSGGDDMAMGSTTATAPIELQNAGALVTAQFQCGAPTINCANYDITFVLQANESLARLEHVTLTISGQKYTTPASLCDSAPWDAIAPQAIGPLDFTVMTGYNNSFSPHLYYACNGTSGNVALDGAQAPAQTSGAIGVEVAGILADASPFVANASAPVR
jgi:hypothetical protein